MTTYNMEKPAEELVAAFSYGPALNELPLDDARKLVDAGQSAFVPVLGVDESWVTLPADVGEVRVRLIKPQGQDAALPVVIYMHGGGWVFGSLKSHGRLARELAVGTGSAVAFVEYSLAPEVKYPVQIEECYTTARWVTQHGAQHGLDPTRIAVAGDSAGGNMAAVLVIMAKERRDVSFVHQSLYYPMTDANAEDSESMRKFRDGPYGTLAVMNWFWDSYLPEESPRKKITVSPLQASLGDLEGLPPALVIVDENDVLRDQGEAYAAKLREAGVPTTSVRFNGTMHDFMMLDALRGSESTQAAMALAMAALRRAFGLEPNPALAGSARKDN